MIFYIYLSYKLHTYYYYTYYLLTGRSNVHKYSPTWMLPSAHTELFPRLLRWWILKTAPKSLEIGFYWVGSIDLFISFGQNLQIPALRWFRVQVVWRPSLSLVQYFCLLIKTKAWFSQKKNNFSTSWLERGIKYICVGEGAFSGKFPILKRCFCLSIFCSL